MIRLFLFMSFLSLNAMAFEIESLWNSNYKKDVIIKCDETEVFCSDLCSDQYICEIEEGSCKDCAGTSLFSTNFFKFIGLAITSNNVVAQYQAVFSLIDSGNFISLTSKSIFNHITRVNSPAIKRQFRYLCDDNTDYPVVLVEVSPVARTPIIPRFVACNSGVYELGDYGAGTLH